MAKKIVDETLKFNIIINGDAAKKEYGQLERANRKLITANEDLEAQAKKLEKANKQNTEEYKQLRAEITKNNTELTQNKSRMNDLTEEIGINNLSMRQLRKEYGRLNGIMNNLDPNTQEWQQYNEQLKSVKARMSELRGEMRATEETMSDNLGVLEQFGAGFMQLFSAMRSGDYNTASAGMQAVGGSIKSATKAAWAFITTPIGAALAALAGVGFIVKEWFNYNERIKESIILTEQITQLQGEQAEAIRQRNEALKNTFGTDEKEQLETARSLVQQFGISYEEAFDQIEAGLVRGQKNNNEFFDSLREYPTFFAQAQYSVEEFRNIVEAGYNLGIYNDKLPDAIKEFNISINEQTKATREALINAFGQTFTDDLLQRVKSGETSTKEALQEVSSEAERLGLNIEQNQRLTADVFRGAGEDAGGAIKIFQAMNVAAESANRALTPLEQSTLDLATANRELEKAQSDALKSDNYVSFTRDLEVFWIKTKTLFFNGLEFITDIFIKSQDFIVSRFVSLVVTAKQLPTILLEGIKNVGTAVLNTIKSLGGLGDVIEKLVKFDFSGAKESAKEFSTNFKTAFSDIKESAGDTVKEILATQQAAQKAALDSFAKRREGNVESVNASTSLEDTNINPNNGNNVDEDAKAEAERQKAIEAALRKKQAVQDAIDKFDEEQAIRDQLKQVEKDQREEEELIIRKELEFERLREEAEGDIELLSELERAEQNELQAIRDEYAEMRLEKEREFKEKLIKDEEAAKQRLVDAEAKFQQAKVNLYNFGLKSLQDFVGKQSALGKMLFAFEKGLAIAQIIKGLAEANAAATFNESQIPAFIDIPFGPSIPNPAKIPSLLATSKQIAANKINAAVSIATITAQAIKGFEEGLYPVTRAQDGKRFNAGISTDTSTGLVNQPTILVGERPEMIIDPNTLKAMDPKIIDYILQLAGKRPLQGFESGDYKTTSPNQTTPIESTNQTNAMLSQVIQDLVVVLQNGIKAKVFYGLNEEAERQQIEDKLNLLKQAAEN